MEPGYHGLTATERSCLECYESKHLLWSFGTRSEGEMFYGLGRRPDDRKPASMHELRLKYHASLGE